MSRPRVRPQWDGVTVIACECGCGKSLSPLDGRGRPRTHIQGHGRTGTRNSPEQNAKIGLANKTSLLGHVPWNFGKTALDDPRVNSRERVGTWKGGTMSTNHTARTKEVYHRWRESVYRRDDFTCQLCWARGGKLNAHHIKPFAKHPELRYDVDNGLTLCLDCHRKLHRSVLVANAANSGEVSSSRETILIEALAAMLGNEQRLGAESHADGNAPTSTAPDKG